MIVCPKCGFEQPKDVFCAKCGINIENYISPEKPPPASRLPRPAYIAAALLLLGVIYLFFHRGQKEVVYEAQETTEAPKTPVETTPVRRDNIRPSQPLRANIAVPVAPIKSFNDQNPSPLDRNSPTDSQGIPATIRIGFAVMSQEALERLKQDADTRGGGPFATITVPGFQSHYDQASQVPGGVKDKTFVTQPVKINQKNSAVKGLGSDKFGFLVEATPVSHHESITDFDILVQRTLPFTAAGGRAEAQTQEFKGTVPIPSGSGALIEGLFPRETLLSGSESFFKSNFPGIYDPNDPQVYDSFQRGATDFVILIAPLQSNNTNLTE